MHHQTAVDKNLKTIYSLWFWHTCDLEIRLRLSNLVWIARPRASFNCAKFERPPSNSVHQKDNNKVFVKSENTLIVSLEYAQMWKNTGVNIFIIYLTYLTILQSFKLSG